jgi:hypothetical protein
MARKRRRALSAAVDQAGNCYYSAEAKAIRRKARLHLKALRRLIAVAEQAIEMAPPPTKDWRGRARKRAPEWKER